MAMKSMAYTAAEAKEEMGEACCGPSTGSDKGPQYPWCLTLYLNDEVLKKLGMDTMPAVGAQLNLNALVTVTGTSQRQQQGGESEQCVDLQITDLDLAAPVGSRQAMAAEKLYGKG